MHLCTISAHHTPSSVKNQILHLQDIPCSFSLEHTSVTYVLCFHFLFFSYSFCICLSPCSRGASPTAADESTFLPAFSFPWPWDGPQDQTGGQHPFALKSLHLINDVYIDVSILNLSKNDHLPPTLHLLVSVYRCTQNRGTAATTCRPDRQRVIWAMCQLSPVPAVPPASVAPATCLSNQNDPGDDSGQSSLAMFDLNVKGDLTVSQSILF